jgi:hypothetical protein
MLVGKNIKGPQKERKKKKRRMRGKKKKKGMKNKIIWP